MIGSAHPIGFITAGNTFSITCIVNGANGLDARFNYKVIAEDNGIIHQEDANDTQLTHSFTARASDAGTYTCEVTVTSTFLNEPITISSTAVTLIVQSKAKLGIHIKEKSRLCTKLLVFSIIHAIEVSVTNNQSMALKITSEKCVSLRSIMYAGKFRLLV